MHININFNIYFKKSVKKQKDWVIKSIKGSLTIETLYTPLMQF